MKEDRRFLQLIFYSRLIGYKMNRGIFRSRFMGEGADYHSSRKYSLEDDARFIDWRVSARTSLPYIKTYQENKALNLFLCVDLSKSLESSNKGMSLKSFAKDLSFIFSTIAVKGNIPIGSVVFGGDEMATFAPSTSKSSIFNMLKYMERNTQKVGTPLVDAIKKTYSVLSTRSLIFIISDFNVASYKTALSKLSLKHDVVAIKLVHEPFYKLPEIGSIEFSDFESSFSEILPTSSKSFIKKRKEQYIEEVNRWKEECIKASATPLLLDISLEPLKTLCAFFSTYNNAKRRA